MHIFKAFYLHQFFLDWQFCYLTKESLFRFSSIQGIIERDQQQKLGILCQEKEECKGCKTFSHQTKKQKRHGNMLKIQCIVCGKITTIFD